MSRAFLIINRKPIFIPRNKFQEGDIYFYARDLAYPEVGHLTYSEMHSLIRTDISIVKVTSNKLKTSLALVTITIDKDKLDEDKFVRDVIYLLDTLTTSLSKIIRIINGIDIHEGLIIDLEI